MGVHRGLVIPAPDGLHRAPAARATLSRRTLLGWLAGGAIGAGAGAVLGAGSQWAAAESPGAGTQVFRSRPGLHPPVITIDVPEAASAVPGLVLTNVLGGPSQQGALVIDGRGDLVWFFPSPGASNVRVQAYRGQPVITWFEGTIVAGHGEGHYQLYNTAYEPMAEVRAAGAYQGDLHEFLLTGTGSALFTCYGLTSGDLSSVGGAKSASYYYGVVQEVDVASGRLLFEWRSDEHIGFDESYVPHPADPSAPWDYFHINSIDIDPTDGNLIVSSRHAWAAYKIDRPSGQVQWRLNGKKSDFAMGPGSHFAFQHDVRRHPDGAVTLFDDEAGPPTRRPSPGAWCWTWTRPGAGPRSASSTTIPRRC